MYSVPDRLVCIYLKFSDLQENPLENLNTAFDVAEKHLDIPRMLDPEGQYYCQYISLARSTH